VQGWTQSRADYQRTLEKLGVELDWPHAETARSGYSHHAPHLMDTDTFYFGEAARLEGGTRRA
jgi:hypothetical protein